MDAAVFREPRKRAVAVPGGEIAGLEFGPQDRPIDIVFVHANGFNAQTYRVLLSPLAAGLRILAIDQRGHGGTTLPAQPDGRRSWRDLRDDLTNLLDALDGPPAVLAGHSMGGTVSLLAAAARPERVKGLVLLDPVIMPWLATLYAKAPWTSGHLWKRMPLVQSALRRRAVFDSREAAFAGYKGRGAFKTWPETMLADYVAGGFVEQKGGKVELACAPAWEASNYAAQAHDPWRAVRQVKAPVRILKAEKHSTCRTGDSFARRGRDVKIETIEGTTHFLPMERPDVVRDALFDMATG
ncbi:alpha/beta fold hydrolase [Caulobacter sp. RHG1]|uniref:alpha/beta fold hydrolase n=1 Tax=Caulobacter sp. (strain RHG1) TaxID=2545762 RepID=UPI0015557AEF|nr:alpha/beta hydrolase [Caulobacter sp. RHG1]NQE63467.1 putative hydrolase [Caulobacter sp. RHG1]